MKQKFTMPSGEKVEHEMPVWKTPYNHNTDFESERTALYCADDSLTKQEFVEDSDINVIMKRLLINQNYQDHVADLTAFQDISERPTYFDMQTRLAEINAEFYQLDAGIRSQHSNDPARWADQVVKAVEARDADRIEELGIPLTQERKQAMERAEKAQAGRSGETAGTPAAETKAPPEAPKGAPRATDGK